MLYLLNTANLECYEYYHPERVIVESGPVAFCRWLEKKGYRPYRTEVQLYKSLLFLKRSIDRELIITSQREALQTLRCILSFPIWSTVSIRRTEWRLRISAQCSGNAATGWFPEKMSRACA